MTAFALAILFGFLTKHLIADYFLQFNWMVADKGDMGRPGGYAHAGMHVVGSAIVLVLAGVQLVLIIALLVAEFIIHFTLDFTKVRYSKGVTPDGNPHKYFALHGFDQYLHQLTYLGMTYVVLFVHLS